MSVNIDTIIDSALERKSAPGVYTTIVSNHLEQMRLFGIRQGVEFFPVHDPTGDRKSLITKLIKESKLDLYLSAMWDVYLGKGSILFYLRPFKNTYELLWFSKNEFEPFWKAGGHELEKVVIKYSYKSKDVVSGLEATRWIRLEITDNEIITTNHEADPGLMSSATLSGSTKTENTLGFIPCVVVDNLPRRAGKRGESEFHWLGNQIEEHNNMLAAINKNLRFFGNPTLIATRSERELVETSMLSGLQPPRKTISSMAGFQGGDQPSTKFFNTNKGLDYQNDVHLRRVIGEVEPDERFGYVQPDPVPGDFNRWVIQYEEQLRTALGGVAENGINAGATAFEIKSLFGRAAATAAKKCTALYDYGLCTLFETAIAIEEKLFRQSFIEATQWDMEKNGFPTDEMIQDYIYGNPELKIKPHGIPPGVIGLMPTGNRMVKWRWTGPVFEDSPQDMLNKSIIGRNLAEEGVNTIEIFKVLFPDKTESEIEAMLGGVPFRRVQTLMGILSQSLGLIQQLGGIPDPAAPNQPLLFRYNLDPIIGVVLNKLQYELSHGNTDIESDDTSGIPTEYLAEPILPTGNTPAGLLPGSATATATADAVPGSASVNGSVIPSMGSINRPTVPDQYSNAAADASASTSAAGLVNPAYAFGIPGQQQPMAAGIQSGGTSPEFTRALPAPGVTVSARDLYPYSGIQPVQPPTIPSGQYGNADLAGQPDILRQLFPSFFAAADAVRKPRNSSKRSRKNKR